MQGGPEAADKFAAAHKALVADSDIQFAYQPPDVPPQPPAWLKAFFKWLGDVLEPVGRFFAWLNGLLPDAPYARIIFWTMLAVLAAALLWLVVQRVRQGHWVWRRPLAPADAEAAADDWAPTEAQGRAWLEEADVLAAEGRYAEAIHHLLIRSVEDIARRRPQLVQPAVTSRELAAAPVLPGRARDIFSGIARIVERSLFGGRAVGPDDWTTARQSYAEFALAKAWTA